MPTPLATGLGAVVQASAGVRAGERMGLKTARAALIGGVFCEKCGADRDVRLHHVIERMHSTVQDVVLLCREHHKAVDHWAR